MSHRIERFTSTLKHSLADILLNDINNPHLKSVSITEVLVTPDFKKARIFVSHAAGSEHEESGELLHHLERAKGFIKRTLGRRMYLKYVPELYFISDERIESPDVISTPDGQET